MKIYNLILNWRHNNDGCINTSIHSYLDAETAFEAFKRAIDDDERCGIDYTIHQLYKSSDIEYSQYSHDDEIRYTQIKTKDDRYFMSIKLEQTELN